MRKFLLVLCLWVGAVNQACFSLIDFGGDDGGNLSNEAENVENYLTIQEKLGQNRTNFPVTVGRPFIKGEIQEYPQAILDGTGVLTQADVKNRWPDGSVKFAIVSFLIPSLAPQQSIKVNFANQSTGNNDSGFLSANEMLDGAYDFDAEIKIMSGATTQTASARAMLSANKFSYWLKGPIITSIILADHSTARTYDMGFDSYKSFRPIFHATFLKDSHQVNVRYIGENANTAIAQDLFYDLMVTVGNAHTAVYAKNSVSHAAFTRWTRRAVINPLVGGTMEAAAEPIAIDMNTAYLKATRFLPNYDLNLKVPESTIAATYGSWQGAAKEVFDKGLWQAVMPSAGGRDDIGWHTTWTTQYLYTWDNRLRELMLGNADLATAWPMIFREGQTGKKFNRELTVEAYGLPMSIVARRTLFLFDGNGYMNSSNTAAADMITFVGPYADNSNWVVDQSHHPEVWFIPYITTGEYFYLDQLILWAMRLVFHGNPLYIRNDVYGGIDDQNRGQAWGLRTRTLAATVAPDGSVEKDYLERIMRDAIAIWEGRRSITGGVYQNTEEYQWGFSTRTPRSQLHFWGPEAGVTSAAAATVDNTKVAAICAPWEQSFLLMSLGRAKELGYPTDLLLTYLAELFTDILNDGAVSPYIAGAYQIPMRKKSGEFINTWAEVNDGYLSTFNEEADYNAMLGDVNHGYPHINRAGFAFIVDENLGNTAWDFVQPQTQITRLNENPKWAINPR